MLIKHQSFDVSQGRTSPKSKRGKTFYEPRQYRYFKCIVIPGIIAFMLFCILMNVDFGKELEETEQNKNYSVGTGENATIAENFTNMVTEMPSTTNTEEEILTDSDFIAVTTEVAIQQEDTQHTDSYHIIRGNEINNDIALENVLPAAELSAKAYQMDTTTVLPIQRFETLHLKQKWKEMKKNPTSINSEDSYGHLENFQHRQKKEGNRKETKLPNNFKTSGYEQLIDNGPTPTDTIIDVGNTVVGIKSRQTDAELSITDDNSANLNPKLTNEIVKKPTTIVGIASAALTTQLNNRGHPGTLSVMKKAGIKINFEKNPNITETAIKTNFGKSHGINETSPRKVSEVLGQLVTHSVIPDDNYLQSTSNKQKPANTAATDQFAKQLQIATGSSFKIGHTLRNSFAQLIAAHKNKQLYSKEVVRKEVQEEEGIRYSSKISKTLKDLITKFTENDGKSLKFKKDKTTGHINLITILQIGNKTRDETAKTTTKSISKLSGNYKQNSTVVENLQKGTRKLRHQFSAAEDAMKEVGNTEHMSHMKPSNSKERQFAVKHSEVSSRSKNPNKQPTTTEHSMQNITNSIKEAITEWHENKFKTTFTFKRNNRSNLIEMTKYKVGQIESRLIAKVKYKNVEQDVRKVLTVEKYKQQSETKNKTDELANPVTTTEVGNATSKVTSKIMNNVNSAESGHQSKNRKKLEAKASSPQIAGATLYHVGTAGLKVITGARYTTNQPEELQTKEPLPGVANIVFMLTPYTTSSIEKDNKLTTREKLRVNKSPVMKVKTIEVNTNLQPVRNLYKKFPMEQDKLLDNDNYVSQRIQKERNRKNYSDNIYTKYDIQQSNTKKETKGNAKYLPVDLVVLRGKRNTSSRSMQRKKFKYFLHDVQDYRNIVDYVVKSENKQLLGKEANYTIIGGEATSHDINDKAFQLMAKILYRTNISNDLPQKKPKSFKVSNAGLLPTTKNKREVKQPKFTNFEVGNTVPLHAAIVKYGLIPGYNEDNKLIRKDVLQSVFTNKSHKYNKYQLTDQVKYNRIKYKNKDNVNTEHYNLQFESAMSNNFSPLNPKVEESMTQANNLKRFGVGNNISQSTTKENYKYEAGNNSKISPLANGHTAVHSTLIETHSRVGRDINISSRAVGAIKCIRDGNSCTLSCNTGSVNFIEEDLDLLMYSCSSKGIALNVQNCTFVNGKMQSSFFSGYYRLRELQIINCNLATIENGAFKWAATNNLESLKLINNSLTSLTDATFVGLNVLKDFEFMQNVMSDSGVGSMFLKPMASTLTNVKIMQILHTKGTVDPKEWFKGADLVALSSVDLQYNNLQGVLNAKTFQTLIAVSELNLQLCSLNTIEIETFVPIMGTLSSLNLNSNNLVTIDPIFLQQMKEHQITLSLKGNNWLCDNEHIGLVGYIQNEDEFAFVSKDDFVCQDPEGLRGTNMLDIPLHSSTTDGNKITKSTETEDPLTTTVIKPTGTPDISTNSPTTDSVFTTTTPTMSTSDPNLEDVTCLAQNSNDEQIIALPKRKVKLKIQPVTATSVIITSLEDLENRYITYFFKGSQYGMVRPFSSTAWNINHLTEEQAYAFCMVDVNNDLESPFDCWPYFVSSSSRRYWLQISDIGWFISVLTIAALMFSLAGVSLVYLVLRQRPTWLFTTNTRVIKMHPLSNKIVLLPKRSSILQTSSQSSAESCQTSRRASYLGPRYGCRTTASIYDSQHQPPMEIAPAMPPAGERGSLCSLYKPPLKVVNVNTLNTHLKSLSSSEDADCIYNEIHHYEEVNF